MGSQSVESKVSINLYHGEKWKFNAGISLNTTQEQEKAKSLIKELVTLPMGAYHLTKNNCRDFAEMAVNHILFSDGWSQTVNESRFQSPRDVHNYFDEEFWNIDYNKINVLIHAITSVLQIIIKYICYRNNKKRSEIKKLAEKKLKPCACLKLDSC